MCLIHISGTLNTTSVASIEHSEAGLDRYICSNWLTPHHTNNKNTGIYLCGGAEKLVHIHAPSNWSRGGIGVPYCTFTTPPGQRKGLVPAQMVLCHLRESSITPKITLLKEEKTNL